MKERSKVEARSRVKRAVLMVPALCILLTGIFSGCGESVLSNVTISVDRGTTEEVFFSDDHQIDESLQSNGKSAFPVNYSRYTNVEDLKAVGMTEDGRFVFSFQASVKSQQDKKVSVVVASKEDGSDSATVFEKAADSGAEAPLFFVTIYRSNQIFVYFDHIAYFYNQTGKSEKIDFRSSLARGIDGYAKMLMKTQQVLSVNCANDGSFLLMNVIFYDMGGVSALDGVFGKNPVLVLYISLNDVSYSVHYAEDAKTGYDQRKTKKLVWIQGLDIGSDIKDVHILPNNDILILRDKAASVLSNTVRVATGGSGPTYEADSAGQLSEADLGYYDFQYNAKAGSYEKTGERKSILMSKTLPTNTQLFGDPAGGYDTVISGGNAGDFRFILSGEAKWMEYDENYNRLNQSRMGYVSSEYGQGFLKPDTTLLVSDNVFYTASYAGKDTGIHTYTIRNGEFVPGTVYKGVYFYVSKTAKNDWLFAAGFQNPLREVLANDMVNSDIVIIQK